MLETRQLGPQPLLHQWLEQTIRPHLTPDHSNYAKGRQRVWLGVEPPLGPTQPFRKGFQWGLGFKARMEEIIQWPFDYCLVTWSGDEGIGIAPHRDASYADYEAMGLNVAGFATFHYWEDRKAFGYTNERSGIKHSDPPSHVVNMTAGTLVRFNCKNLHSASPEPNRWGMNFWRAKP